MKTVAGTFDNQAAADRAIATLLDEGFSKNEFSLLMTEKTHNTVFNITDDEANSVAKGGLTGAMVGGAIGALLAGLTGVGVFFVPGMGLLASGPVIAALSGAGAGAAVGGLSGALINAGFAADEAHRFEKELKDGKAVVLVHPTTELKSNVARSVLKASGAYLKAA
jgi:hypothetical protein